MGIKLRHWLHQGCFALTLPLFAQEGKAKGKFVAAPDSGPTSAFGELLKEWWLWTGIVVLLGLVGLLFYLRNRSEDDD
ncbi:MAG: hypothetical protein JNM56_10475 [Planctomycetia bacterium]|nr:hypothetical protein [Planctomycetia bacterium]